MFGKDLAPSMKEAMKKQPQGLESVLGKPFNSMEHMQKDHARKQ